MSTVQKKGKKGGAQKKPLTPKQQEKNMKRKEARQKKRQERRGVKGKVVPNTLGLEGVGAHGTDPRIMRLRQVNKSSNAAPTQDVTLNIEPYVPSAAIKFFSLGIVLAAKKKGWNGGNIPDHAFQAFRYIIDALTNAFEGTIPQLASAPRWFWEILYAVGPKSHSFKTSSAYYEAFIAEGQPSVSSGELSIGAGLVPYIIMLGATTSATYNGFAVVAPTAAYDAGTAAAAVSSLWDTFPSEKGKPSELIGNPGEENAYLRYDVSAYAQNLSIVGLSTVAPGGSASNAVSEVHIDCPILSKFALSNELALTGKWRNPHRLNHNGGTACYIGPRCVEFDRITLFKNKAPVFAKFYNFDEFYEHAALILALGQEAASRNTTQTVIPYPLTVQQFKIMLRQALLPLFNNEMAQDLQLISLGSNNTMLTMYPLSVGDNGFPSTAIAPLFPKFFVEMCRGAVRLTSRLASKFSDTNQYLDYIPVLARSPEINEIGNYNWKDAAGTDHLLFDPPGSEFAMSMIDCKVVDAGTPYYLSLSGQQLGTFVTSHNEWMTAMSANFSGLTTLVAAASTPLFATNCYTLISRPIVTVTTAATASNAINTNTTVTTQSPATTPKLTKQSSQKRIDSKNKGRVMERKRYGVAPIIGSSDFFTTYNQSMITSSVGFNREFTKYLDLMIVPTVYSTNNEDDSSASYLQTAYCEGTSRTLQPNNVDQNVVNDVTADTMYSKHFQAASLDIKAPGTGSVSEVDDLFTTLTQKGEGSFLGGLAKFLQIGGSIAGRVGQMLDD